MIFTQEFIWLLSYLFQFCFLISPTFSKIFCNHFCSRIKLTDSAMVFQSPPKAILFDIGGVCVSSSFLLCFPPSKQKKKKKKRDPKTRSFISFFFYRSSPPSQPSKNTNTKTTSPPTGSISPSPGTLLTDTFNVSSAGKSNSTMPFSRAFVTI